MLTEKLTRDQQFEILNTLFGFYFDDDILIDDDGDEFYSYSPNCEFDFTTLAGIFSYCAYRAANKGYSNALYDVRKALGL